MTRFIFWGRTFVAHPEHGCFYEDGIGDVVGRLVVPMFADGTPDYDNIGEIAVTYEDA